MSFPVVEEKIHVALCELISAASALNMEPAPIDDADRKGIYLSESDEWAEHSMEHLRAGISGIRGAASEIYQATEQILAHRHNKDIPEDIWALVYKIRRHCG